MNDTNRELPSLFADVMALPPTERDAYLDNACGSDGELKEQVRRLVAKTGEGVAFFDDLEVETSKAREKIVEEPEKAIGRYQLLEQIGEGGCGVVYRAEQAKPVQRQVALKIIKLGMDTRQVVARFDAERQALAMMDHPNIARVIDAGATQTGRPYFVMELVRGRRITEYCDDHRLSIPLRLDLFIQVCRAIQHAHQKGLIHRDIKPSNVLVAVQDGTACPKVIDFGIAKATQGRLTDQTVSTAADQFIGTPAYMSPEQAEQGRIDIDTRSDIYSLGVLLYELLTGRSPFDSKELMKLGVGPMLQTIREVEPARPSARLADLPPDELLAVAANRQIEPGRLVPAIRGDLDWIIVKALEKDRSRRYATVHALIRDIERYLASEPVQARPPSRLYSISRVVRRNRLAVAAGAAVLAALVVGLGLSTWLFLREREARHQLQGEMLRRQELQLVQERMRVEAEKESIKSKALAQSLQTLLERFGAEAASNPQDLKKMVEQVKATSNAYPKNRAILGACALICGGVGLYEEAGNYLNESYELDPGDAWTCHLRAATLLLKGDLERYRDQCRRALERFQDTTDACTAERIAKDSLLSPDFHPDMRLVDQLIKTALATDPSHDLMLWFQLAAGMAEHRKGEHEAAIARLRAVPQGRIAYVDAQAALIVAMSLQRSNRPSEAIEVFDRIDSEIAANFTQGQPHVGGGNWVDQVMLELLHREARKVVRGEPTRAIDGKTSP